MTENKPAVWFGEATFGSHRTQVAVPLPDHERHEVEMVGSVVRIDGELRPDIPVHRVLGKSRGVYERPAAIDNRGE